MAMQVPAHVYARHNTMWQIVMEYCGGGSVESLYKGRPERFGWASAMLIHVR